jgi:hypothetical protein
MTSGKYLWRIIMLLELSSQEKDVDITLTLDIQILEALSKVSNDTFYQDKVVWKHLSVEYINPTTNQTKQVPIDYNGETTTIDKVIKFSSYFVGSSALFNRIIVYDKGNGFLEISRSDVPSPENLDIAFV